MDISLCIGQTLLLMLFAPLVSGIIKKIKNNLRMRIGASVFQPYYNLAKLFAKEEVVSSNASWIFRVTPFIVLASSISALLLVPVFISRISLNSMGDLLLIVFVLALGRFFLALSGLDTGSAFGGMGSSRETFISSLIEPVAVMSIFVVSLNVHSTNPQIISSMPAMAFSSIIAATALFFVIIAETSRIPVDNQETHLELTMVHEAMVLEYSGRSLALIEFASYIKQIIFFSLIASVIFPWGISSGTAIGPLFISIGAYCLKITVLCVFISVLEVSVAKMRLFRIVDFANIAFVLSVLGVIISSMGR